MNRLDEPVFIAASKPLLTEFGIRHRLESCGFICLINDLYAIAVCVHINGTNGF